MNKQTAQKPTVRDVLVAARKLIETPDLWCKDTYRNGPARCASGAVHDVCGLSDGPYDALAKAMDTDDVSRWNDAPERTHSEILAAFDKAIAGEQS